MSNKRRIYTITTFHNFKTTEKETSWGYSYDEIRTPGFFFTLQEAKDCVESNMGDINEAGYYERAVIECVEEGLYGITKETYWYKWDKTANSYIAEESDPVKYIAGWSIG